MSGLSRYALELSESLPKQGVEVELIEARLDGKMRWLADRAKILGPDLAAFWGTYPLRLPTDNSRLYHLTHAGLAAALYLSPRDRVVVTVHDIIHYIFRNDRNLSTYRHPLHKQVDKLGLKALPRASAIIAISEFTKSTLVEHLDLDPDTIQVVHRGVNLERFRPLEAPADFWQRHGLDRQHRYILHLSSGEYRKNVPALIRAFARVAGDFPETRLLKIGRSHYPANRQRLMALVEELGLADRVIFIEAVSDEDLPHFYNTAEMFAMPSLYEGFGLPVLEAMACGCPVICSDASSLPEVAASAGFYIEATNAENIAQAIGRLLEDSSLADRLSTQGIEQAQQLSSTIEGQRTMEVYRQVLA
jgi:glycosyltransferase involved in cell wall biosynthesis